MNHTSHEPVDHVPESLIRKGARIDDVLAILLALAARPEEVEVLLLSVTYGNIELEGYVGTRRDT